MSCSVPAVLIDNGQRSGKRVARGFVRSNDPGHGRKHHWMIARWKDCNTVVARNNAACLSPGSAVLQQLPLHWHLSCRDRSNNRSRCGCTFRARSSVEMVLIDIDINLFNVLKFLVLEMLISCVLEPGWELIISRSAHARVVKGEKVTLAPLKKWRTFPCALSTGRISRYGAAALSLLTFGGSLASEYAVNSVPVLQNGTETALVYSRSLGRNSLENSSSMKAAVEAAAVMTERCYYRDRDSGKYFVNASFAPATFSNVTGGGVACVSNNLSERYEVSDVCILTAGQAGTGMCTWDESNGRFARTFDENYLRNQTKMVTNSNIYSDIHDLGGNRELVLHICVTSSTGEVSCSKIKTYKRRHSAQLFCDSNPSQAIELVCLYVSEHWILLSRFDTRTGFFPSYASRYSIPYHKLVYRNLRGVNAFDNFSSIDLNVLKYFQGYFRGSYEGDIDVQVYRQREAVTLMLLLEGFGRTADLRRMRDYRQDKFRLHTNVNVPLLVPLFIVTGMLGVGSIVAACSQPKRGMVLQVPVSIEQLMRALRARETGEKSAFGPGEAKLRLGIERVNMNDQEMQKFSVDVTKSVPYDAAVPWE